MELPVAAAAPVPNRRSTWLNGAVDDGPVDVPPHPAAPPSSTALAADATNRDAKRARVTGINMTQVRRSRGEVRGARFAVLLVLLAAGIAAPAAAPSREAIRYTLRFPAPQSNSVEFETVLPSAGRLIIAHM